MVGATVWNEGEHWKRDVQNALEGGTRAPAMHQRLMGPQTGSRLAATIEGEIIPRLLLAFRSSPTGLAAEGPAETRLSADEVVKFARLVTSHDVTVGAAYVNALLNRGVTLETIYLKLLAPAARLLGEWWTADLNDFTEVTSGLCRMHQLVHEFSRRFLRDAGPVAPNKSILLMSMPGEQHSFGLILVAEFFRRAGWDVWDAHPATVAEALQSLDTRLFAIVGISLSCESRIGEMSGLIAAIRGKSRNPAVSIMVGGQPFVGHPEKVSSLGADGTALDGQQAVIAATRLLASRAPSA
jgi:MerR family transcriptional regulator, light-induced transcriptional regulator